MGDAELVMPLVPVASKGGPYDDDAYAAGWEMGLMDRALADKPEVYVCNIHVANREQADLIAMRHGYVITAENPIAQPDEPLVEWMHLRLEPGEDG